MSLIGTLKFITHHPMCRQRPAEGIARFAHWQLMSRLKAEIATPWVGGSRLVAQRGMTGATGNIYCGLHQFAEMGLLLHLLRPGDMFIDGGANIGSYTVLASKVCGATTAAFEPDLGTAAALGKNVLANGIADRVAIHEVALGESAGQVRFTVGADTTNHVTDDPKGRAVPVSRLDAFDLEPTLIKLDLEGYEEKALIGASKTLASPSLLALILETVTPKMQEMLAENGFSVTYYNPFTRELGMRNTRPMRSMCGTLPRFSVVYPRPQCV